jgi:nucleoside-diphosphate-sugar epimerase
MSNLYIVTGAGPVGTTVAEQLAAQGHRVRVLTRSGGGPDHPLVERLAVDVSRPDKLDDLFAGASAIFHCIHGSAYSTKAWEAELPAAEQTVLAAADRAGAVVVFPESLYSYDRPDEVMTEDGLRRASTGKRGVRTALLAARAASPTPTVSVVASDFFGPHVLNAHAGERMVPLVLAGKTIRVLGDPDQPHSFTYVPDLAAAMIAAAGNRQVWNHVLHAPTLPALTQRGMARAYAQAAGVPTPKVGSIPSWLLRGLALVMPGMRELIEMLYQFEQPFVMSSGQSEELLGLQPTPLEAAAADTVTWWRERQAAGSKAGAAA